MSASNGRGSEWRKWDLQVQTRRDAQYLCLGQSTLSEEQLEKLKSVTGLSTAEITSQEKSISPEKYAKLFVSFLTNFSDISVVGITDHNSGKELDSLLFEAEQTDGKLVILPGVEIASNQGIHILCLFDPRNKWKETWAESIDHLLTEFGVPGSGFNEYQQPLHSSRSAQEIMEIVDGKKGLCIFAHIGTDNGLFKNSSTANGGTAHIDIYTHPLCNVVQIPHSSTLTPKVANIIDGKDANYGNKCVTKIKCSDARKLSDVGSQFVWIKSDTTFEGLKQIIFEQTERVRIQETNPYSDNRKVFFSQIKLSGSTSYILPDFELPLNRGLVAVIGGRGSGKSALLDTFAFLNEEHLRTDRNDKPKIIEYYRGNEGHTEPPPSFTLNTTLVDKDDIPHVSSKSLEDRINLELPFLYLGQEELSGIATNDSELTRTVCQLIGIDTNESEQKTLISRARGILSEIDNTEKEKSEIAQRYIELGYLEAVELDIWAKNHLKKLREQKERLSSVETREVLEEINEETRRGLMLKELSAKADLLLVALKNIPLNFEIVGFNEYLSRAYESCKSIAGLDASTQITELENIKRRIAADMNELRGRIIVKKQGLMAQGIKEDVNSLLLASENLEKQITAIESDLANYSDLRQRLVALRSDRDSILSEISVMMENLTNRITTAFVSFQNSREDSAETEKALFETMMGGIEVKGQIIFDEKTFSKEVLENYIDNRKIANLADLRGLIAGLNSDGSSKEISFENLISWVKSDQTSKSCFNRAGIKNFVSFVFTEWPTFLRVRAIAKLNGKATEILSIGQRGTLLLKVYLATSTAKQVLIIDQPEDNLDNNFIMNELVPLIRQAKRSRQIIMSTHNANLVVNSDAEQVVLASLDKGGAYASGSMECPAINTAIKDILEGGEQAFLLRERRYQLVTK